MSFENVVLTTALLLSSGTYRVTRSYAKHDMDPNATLVYRQSIIVPDESTGLSNVADYYRVEVYCEKDYSSTAIPLSQVGCVVDLTSPQTPTTVEWSKENVSSWTYSGSASVSTSLSQGVEAGFDFAGFAKLSGGITKNISASLCFGLSYTTSIGEMTTVSKYVDGVENPYGVYALYYCILSASQYYFNYVHTRYNNYDKQEMYQTKLLYEDVDTHVFLPSTNDYVLKPFYFSSYQEYTNFKTQWCLN